MSRHGTHLRVVLPLLRPNNGKDYPANLFPFDRHSSSNGLVETVNDTRLSEITLYRSKTVKGYMKRFWLKKKVLYYPFCLFGNKFPFKTAPSSIIFVSFCHFHVFSFYHLQHPELSSGSKKDSLLYFNKVYRN